MSESTKVCCGARLAETGAAPSIGGVDDGYDTALTETVNGYYEAALVRGPTRDREPLEVIADLELATLTWVLWRNDSRLPGYPADLPRADDEAANYADQTLVESL